MVARNITGGCCQYLLPANSYKTLKAAQCMDPSRHSHPLALSFVKPPIDSHGREHQTLLYCLLPWVLRHCSLGIRESNWPVKVEWWGVDVVICLDVWTVHFSVMQRNTETHDNTHTHNRLMAVCPGLPGYACTRRNIHPLTPTRKKKDSHRQPARVVKLSQHTTSLSQTYTDNNVT